MRRTQLQQEVRKMRFEEAYWGWQEKRLDQEEAASLLGACARTFRRYIDRYEEAGIDGLIDRRLEQMSHRRAPVDEVLEVTDQYRRRHEGWSANHFHAWYRKDGGTRSYTWVKSRLQEAGLLPKARSRGAHRKRRTRSAWPGLMIHQDATLTAALLDRLLHHAHIVPISGESCRLKHQRQAGMVQAAADGGQER